MQNGADACNQRLVKVLADIEAADAVIAAQKAQLAADSKVIDLQEDLAERQKAIIAAQDKKIEMLEKKAQRKISILFGLIKIRY